MSKPKPKSHYALVRRFHRPIGWAVIVIGAVLVDYFRYAQGQIAYAVALGSALNYVIYWVFAYVSYRNVRTGQPMFWQMGLALMLKWVVAVVGFVLIFTKLPHLSAAAVLAGFIAMQLVVARNLWQLGKHL